MFLCLLVWFSYLLHGASEWLEPLRELACQYSIDMGIGKRNPACGGTLQSPSFPARRKEGLRSTGHSLGQVTLLACPMNLLLAFRLRQGEVPRSYPRYLGPPAHYTGELPYVWGWRHYIP